MSFRTADEAAIHILKTINPRSIIENFEYAGFIYKTENGYDFTIPNRGTPERPWDRSNTSLRGIQIPPNALEVGFYHTHGDYTYRGAWSPALGRHLDRRATGPQEVSVEQTPFGTLMLPGDHFSDGDLRTINGRGNGIGGYRGYLGTPSGVLYYYDAPNDNNQHVLYRGNRPIVRP